VTDSLETTTVSEAYTAALWVETGAWNDLQGALRRQRAAIVHREIEAVWASQDELQGLLGSVAACHAQSRRLRPTTIGDELKRLERETVVLRQQARDSLQLNHELLKDICCYLDMMREVVHPHTLPPTYGDPRDRARPAAAPNHSVSRTA
jgi:hypothetical protein